MGTGTVSRCMGCWASNEGTKYGLIKGYPRLCKPFLGKGCMAVGSLGLYEMHASGQQEQARHSQESQPSQVSCCAARSQDRRGSWALID